MFQALWCAGETYLRLLEAAKAGAPDIHVHAFSPLEVRETASLNSCLPQYRVAHPLLVHLSSASLLTWHTPEFQVTEGAKTLGWSLRKYLTALKDAGLGSLPGTAAEVLDDETRAIICPDKLNTAQWLEVSLT